MNLLETIHTAITALRAHKLRSCLTALGIIIGTSATIATLAIGAGARAQVAAQVQSLGSNLLIIVSGNVNQSGVKLGAGATPTLTDEDAATIGQEIPSVQVTSSLISGKIQVVAEAANWATSVATVDLAISKCGIGLWTAAARLRQTKPRTVPRSRSWDRQLRDNCFPTSMRSVAKSGSRTCPSGSSESLPRKASPPQGRIRMMRLLSL